MFTLNGYGIRTNEKDAINLLIKAAEKGHFNAQIALGKHFVSKAEHCRLNIEVNELITQHLEKAIKYLGLAANPNNAEKATEMQKRLQCVLLLKKCTEEMQKIIKIEDSQKQGWLIYDAEAEALAKENEEVKFEGELKAGAEKIPSSALEAESGENDEEWIADFSEEPIPADAAVATK